MGRSGPSPTEDKTLRREDGGWTDGHFGGQTDTLKDVTGVLLSHTLVTIKPGSLMGTFLVTKSQHEGFGNTLA